MFEILTLFLVKVLAWLSLVLGAALSLRDLVLPWFCGAWLGPGGISVGFGGWPVMTGFLLLGLGLLAGMVLAPVAGPLVLLGTLIARTSSR